MTVMNLRSIAALALAEDAAHDIGAAGFNPPTNPDFESKHPRGNAANKGQFRKSEKTLAKLDEADAALQTGDFDLFNLIGNPEAVAPMSAKEQSELDAAVVEESLKPVRDRFAAFRARVASDPDYFAGDVAESAKRNKDFRGFIDDIGKLIAKHQQTIDDWAGRAYRQSDKSVDVRSRDETGERDGVSVNLINESRRRRRIESERRAIDKLEKSLEDALGTDYKDLISAANKHSLSPDGQTAFDPAAEYAAVEAKYKGTPEWMKAPNGEPTNLTERQWVQVRTPSFKAWFGDWEKVAKGSAVVGQKPIAVKPLPEGVSVEDAYARLPETENAIDGRQVKFVNSTLGKILRHKGYPTERIIGQLDEIFKASIPTSFEEETVKEGHKKHPNFEGYHTYVGKIRDGEREYYVRFTVQEEKTRSKDYNPNAVHSTFVSDVTLYKETGGALSQSTTSVGESEQPPITDNRLSQFFAEVNGAMENCSKVIDSNGEPMVVYHGSQWDPLAESQGKAIFNTKSPPKHHDMPMQLDFGTHFTIDKKTARGYGRNVTEAFLNIRNPKIVADGFLSKDTYDGILREGFDGVDYTPTSHWVDATGDNPVNNVYMYPRSFIVMDPSQIKSATANSGAFSPDKESFLDSAPANPSPDGRTVFDQSPAPAFNPAAVLTYLAGKRKE